jgi:hypothetical protein
MVIQVTTSDELHALRLTYMELAASARESTLEIVVAPGVYGVASIGPIQLDLGANGSKIDVVLRGEGSVVFDDLLVSVNARSLHLENLVLRNNRRTLLDARVANRFSMRGCVVSDNMWGGPPGGALMQVTGTYGKPAPSVHIADTWFVRNGGLTQAALLEVRPATGSFVDHLHLDGVVFLDNGVHADLQLVGVKTININDVVARKKKHTVIRHSPAQRMTIQHSVFIVDIPSQVAMERIGTQPTGFELSDSRLYATGARWQMPPHVRGNSRVSDRHLLRPRGDVTVEALASAAQRGLPDRAALHEALGL